MFGPADCAQYCRVEQYYTNNTGILILNNIIQLIQALN